MIRDKFHKDIIATINSNPRFDSSDFKIEPNRQNGNTILTINYVIEPKYKIEFKLPNSITTEKDGYQRSYYAFTGNVCPGPMVYEESFSFHGEEGVFEKINGWLKAIWEELSSNPVVKQIENQQQQIDNILEQFDGIQDEYFTKEESADLKSRLDALEETLKSQIHKNGEDKKSFEAAVAKLHMDIDTLKQTVDALKKKGWFKSFTSKVIQWTSKSENRKLLTDGYTIIREFLPNDVKASLPPAGHVGTDKLAN